MKVYLCLGLRRFSSVLNGILPQSRTKPVKLLCAWWIKSLARHHCGAPDEFLWRSDGWSLHADKRVSKKHVQESKKQKDEVFTWKTWLWVSHHSDRILVLLWSSRGSACSSCPISQLPLYALWTLPSNEHAVALPLACHQPVRGLAVALQGRSVTITVDKHCHFFGHLFWCSFCVENAARPKNRPSVSLIAQCVRDMWGNRRDVQSGP